MAEGPPYECTGVGAKAAPDRRQVCGGLVAVPLVFASQSLATDESAALVRLDGWLLRAEDLT